MRIGDLPPQAARVLAESTNMSRTVREALLFYAGCLSAREVLRAASPQPSPSPAEPEQSDAAFASLLGGIAAAIGE